MKVQNGKLESNIVQFFSQTEQQRLLERFGAKDGDVLMMIADTSPEVVNGVLNNLRLHVADRLNLISLDRYCPLWVMEFPLFELKEDGLSSQHHPFTMPDRTDFDPENMAQCLRLNSRAYDLVINGEELGGGSVRIHEMEVQEKIFKALGLTKDEVEAKFGFFLRALEYGTPPHAGLALGLDRVIAMILKVSSIREVIAFPKNRRAFCPLSSAPSPVDQSQLDELGLVSEAAREWFKRSTLRSTARDFSKPGDRRPEKISLQEVKHVARLARLRITDAEAESYQKELNAVLEHFETLQELDTENVEPMSHVLEMKNVWREDRPGKAKKPDSLLENAPVKESDYFKVPKILEG
jgi:aspartyl-tRNA synthetase